MEENILLSVDRSEGLYHHGVQGQKWGVKNGPPYPLENSTALSSKIYSEAKKKEPEITKNLMQIAKNNNAKMYGLENRLKTESSINRKIKKESEENGVSQLKASKGIKDAVRYTFMQNNDDYVDTYYKIKNEMQNNGYTEIKCKNYFQMYKEGKVKHKAVQSIFEDKDGYKFEVQFQTPESQMAKNKKIPLYEERRQTNLSEDRKKYLENEMVKLAENVPYPKDIETIKSF